MSQRIVVMVVVLICMPAGVASAEVQRLYVLDCGRNLGRDQACWSPGVNEGKPIEFSDNCYLIRHTKGLLLWDTGVPDAVAAMPDGMVVANGAITYRRAKTLAAQLTELGVKPEDITYVAVSHTHGDHVGNVALFPSSTVLIQAAEYDWAMAGQNKPAFAASQEVRQARRRSRCVRVMAPWRSCRRPVTRRVTSPCSFGCPKPGTSSCRATPCTSGTTGSTSACHR